MYCPLLSTAEHLFCVFKLHVRVVMYEKNLNVAKKNTRSCNANEPKEAEQDRLGYEEHEAGTNPPLHGGVARESSCGHLLDNKKYLAKVISCIYHTFMWCHCLWRELIRTWKTL